jgi:hypothetical protein
MYKKILASALVLAMVMTAGAALAQTQTPSGTISIKLNSASAVMGASWGQAVLTFEGRTHRFRVRGLKVGSAGIRRLSLRGDVYNINNVNELAGTFRRADLAGLTFIAGERGLVIRNDQGVTINLVGQKRGLSLDLVQEGLTLQPAPTR